MMQVEMRKFVRQDARQFTGILNLIESPGRYKKISIGFYLKAGAIGSYNEDLRILLILVCHLGKIMNHASDSFLQSRHIQHKPLPPDGCRFVITPLARDRVATFR